MQEDDYVDWLRGSWRWWSDGELDVGGEVVGGGLAARHAFGLLVSSIVGCLGVGTRE